MTSPETSPTLAGEVFFFMLIMADTAFNSQFPAHFDAYAGYVDGHVGSQPNYQWVVQNFPGKFHLSISVFGNDADCLDIEPGAATVASASGWYLRQKRRGLARPCFYASASLMNSDLIPAITAAGIERNSIRLWSAHYTGHPHICGPSSCGLLSMPADGTQWTDMTGSLTADQSLLSADFFAADPKPDLPGTLTDQEMTAIMSKLPVLQQGAADTAGQPFFVRRMQALINGVISWKPVSASQIAVDGSFGQKTADALRAVQGAYNVSQDGICGPATWRVLITGSAS